MPGADLASHSQPAEAVLGVLGSDARVGLGPGEAAARLSAVGPNELRRVRPTSVMSILLAQLKGVIAGLLVVALGVSLATGDGLQALAIGVVLAINAGLGTVTELRARRAIEALLQLDVPRAVVVRDGQLQGVDARDLVPGDIIEVGAGGHVPADGRLIRSLDLRVDEAPLTGESLPVGKEANAHLSADTPLAERLTMVYKGTTVVAGQARAVVTATGAATEVGRIGTLTSAIVPESTPLERKLDILGRRLVWATLVIAAAVAGLGLADGQPLGLVVETAIALAVAAVPEALPAVATITLAVGMHRMARRRALVRRLPAVEALGATTVVCTDKTRTLTSGRMQAVRAWPCGAGAGQATGGGEHVDERARGLLGAAARASQPQPEGDHARHDPVDAAMTDAARLVGMAGDRYRDEPVVDVVPFASSRQRMAVIRRDAGGALAAYVKGAPRAVLAACDRVDGHPTSQPLTAATRSDVLAMNDRMAGEGLRVIGVAAGPVAGRADDDLTGLTFLGLIGLADPPAPGVGDVVGRLRRAGLRTVMLTGDQRLTAESVGRAVGLMGEHDAALDGRALDGLTDEALAAAVRTHAAFTRVTPEHKLAVVRALQADQEVVAMIGDGINDAAALRQADVGVAMGGRGTDVAKQAASIVLQDDRFETIAAAVEEGRVIFDNISKFVFYLFSCNVAEVLVLFGAGLAALPLPLLPLQLLWLNLVTDTFPALALAMEPKAADVMSRPPRRPDAAILSRAFVGRVLYYAGWITTATLCVYVWALGHAPAEAATMTFMTLALAQIGHLGTARTRESLLGPRAWANGFAVAGALAAVALQAAAAFVPPLAAILGVARLDLRLWGIVLAAAAVPAVVGELHKAWGRNQP
jgi:P-type Ca2+ transporter type 2C